MASDVQSHPEHESLATLVTGILNDGQELFRQQVKLTRHEIKEDLRKTKEASIPLVIGLWLASMGGLLLCITLALILEAAGLPQWAAFAIVGAAVSVAGGVLVYVGKAKFDSFNPLPDESAEALKENLEWITKPK